MSSPSDGSDELGFHMHACLDGAALHIEGLSTSDVSLVSDRIHAAWPAAMTISRHLLIRAYAWSRVADIWQDIFLYGEDTSPTAWRRSACTDLHDRQRITPDLCTVMLNSAHRKGDQRPGTAAAP